MKSLWREAEAKKMVGAYARQGVNKDLALRVYTTRLLGGDPRLVLHGGGNTSVKTRMKDVSGKTIDVLCVKGSGWDMGAIEPRGLPALRIDALQALRPLKALSDEDMVDAQRGALLDSTSPNPSVETLLHTFLPHKFIDHTHSTAVLAVTDQPDGDKIAADIYGDRAALVPYVMPGFDLAIKAAEVYEANRDVEGLILLKHGIFSFGETAREAYERMISLVTVAEDRLKTGRKKVFVSAALPKKIASVADVAPILRGLIADNDGASEPKRMVLDFRTNKAIRTYVNGKEAARYSQIGVVTPDHNIRTKNWPLLVAAPDAGDVPDFIKSTKKACDKFAATSHKYFARHNGKRDAVKVELDTTPRVILVPGLGLFGVGKSASDAAVAADIAENTVNVITDAEAIGTFRPIPETDMFDIEYWSLEQAKLSKGAEAPLARRVAIVTGGAGGIGEATARMFAAQGAAVVVLDRDAKAVARVADDIAGAAMGIACDVTDARAVRRAFDHICKTYGGVDIVVSNAGAAWQGRIGEVSDKVLRQSFELNFFAHQTIAQNAVRVMQAQGTGGALLFNTSKQAVNPGQDFGPYGLPKAATLFLMKQYALEYGVDGITSNAVNADRVNTGIFAGGMLEDRAKARGLTVKEYLGDGNLLKREVTVDDVAKAFLDLALGRKTTAAVLTVDGGNIAASLR
ncbi:MAG: bifunctional aldolase/short-chain dehydrogenase [Alphaproteobacteria bacterium]|jgi:rhamnulose-1-phosphate aldolase/alcohol dehydrogenase|nr:bifunctional aldolase/short-chain dehydrogenase [Alphaproteobacteria bacterium]MBT4016340.1 bifunctional aldolase/short-chain dehydrogenase [Alphaproteobacteria bacterium]MBT5159232.1 bifunctional aldolase/short-chain dehydrogenase [Alphaproteobacteria bacterium]MBT5917340.1 bifunctional aldolase/short-chain dehydrogenase [Alphaproteobacteria bacterium]